MYVMFCHRKCWF